MILNDVNWFQLSPIPSDAMTGTYNYYLVALSYVIAVLASYVALNLAGRLQVEENKKARLYWLFGGAFAMGAGIWSMHFIGMLAFVMPMPMECNLFWTVNSLLVAMAVSGFALFVLQNKDRKVSSFMAAGVLIGLGICIMHYMGMYAMTNYVAIHYLPSLFILSIVIAIVAAEAALWLALHSNQGSAGKQFYLKIISSLVMGVAICGMHYTGMAAAVFTHLDYTSLATEVVRPDLLAFFVAGITGLIISLALTVSTYYKNMIDAVQNEKEFLNAMVDNLEDGIIACDGKGTITVLTDSLRNSLDIPKEGNLNNNLLTVLNYFEFYLPEEDQPLSHEEFPLYRALHGEIIHSIELKAKVKRGEFRHVIVSGQPIVNAHGNKLGAVITIHDVTEIKKSEKMKSEFVSVVSHELRTPLTSIRGSLGLLLGKTVGDFNEKAARLLEIANKNCDRLLLLINDILDMEKIQEGKMKFDLKVVNIKHVVNESVFANKMYAEKFGVKLNLIDSIDIILVRVDPDRLLQVLANLISNAAKFSNQGEAINISIEKCQDRVRVSIIDTGAGIPLEFQSQIFQKFSQADSSNTRGKGGTGLGLSISKAIIEKLGGSLDFTSKPGEGTTFYFDLAIQNVDQPALLSSHVKVDKEIKILICEDDEDQAKLLNLLLEGAGLYSDMAFNANEAKALLAKNTYHAILMDLILPDQDGISLIRELRQRDNYKDIPIVVMSTITETGRELLSNDALSVIDWLDKPVNLGSLLDTLSHIKIDKKMKLPHILHVEDSVDMQYLVGSLLEKEAKITTSTTIIETIHKLGEGRFDLIILDLSLPDGKGTDLLPVFSKYNIPIVVYSASELDKEYVKYASKVLVKSNVTNEELVDHIKKMLTVEQKECEHVE